MPADESHPPSRALYGLMEEVDKRSLGLQPVERDGYVGSELLAANRVLARVRAEGLATGPLFCEWGSGLGGVAGVAALNGFISVGIEIRGDLVDAARSMASTLDLQTVFAKGTYLLPGDEDLVAPTTYTQPVFDGNAWDELGITPGECNVVFAYPWPGEEACVDGVFARHASPGALLLTFHDRDRVLVQRKLADHGKLHPLGWM